MKNLGLFTVMAALALFALPSSHDVAQAQEVAKKDKPLRGVVRPAKRRGGYSYKYLQGTDTRRFVDPTLQNQTNAGPFDSGFFFSTPNAPHGGDSPYMQ
jgi:hypothetical protein